jgi:hypothetical protein
MSLPIPIRRAAGAARMKTFLSLSLALLASLAAPHAAAVTCLNNLPPLNPDAAYVDQGNGTVTDGRSGLTWKRCAEGQAWDGAACSGSPTFHDWPAALALAEASGFAGHDDWRLPNLKELLSLVETCRSDPAINDTIFPNTLFAPAENFSFWSSTPQLGSAGQNESWFVRTGRGDTGNDPRSATKFVRMVRGAQ